MNATKIDRSVEIAESQLDRARALLLEIVLFVGMHDKNLLPWMVSHVAEVKDALDNVQGYVGELESAANRLSEGEA